MLKFDEKTGFMTHTVDYGQEGGVKSSTPWRIQGDRIQHEGGGNRWATMEERWMYDALRNMLVTRNSCDTVDGAAKP